MMIKIFRLCFGTNDDFDQISGSLQDFGWDMSQTPLPLKVRPHDAAIPPPHDNRFGNDATFKSQM